MRLLGLLAVLCQFSTARADDAALPHDAPPVYLRDPPERVWLQPLSFGLTAVNSGSVLGAMYAGVVEYSLLYWLALGAAIGVEGNAPTVGLTVRTRMPIGRWAIGIATGVSGVGEVHVTQDLSNLVDGTIVRHYDIAPSLLSTAEVTLERRTASGLGVRLAAGLTKPVSTGSYRCTELYGNNGLDSVIATSIASTLGGLPSTSTPRPTTGNCSGALSLEPYVGATLTYTPRRR